ncbi:MAG: heavy-metal-associated domain-containing protein [Bradymonadaceae bacterium]
MQSSHFFSRDSQSCPSTGWRGVLSFLAVIFVLGIASPAFAAVESYTIGVDGMACPFCAYGIEKKLKALDGVESLDIHIKKGTVDVHLKEGGEVTPDELKTAIKEAGFKIRDLHVRGEASVEKQNGSAVAQFTDDFGLPITGTVSKTGKQTVRGKIVRKQGTWKLAVTRSGGKK